MHMMRTTRMLSIMNANRCGVHTSRYACNVALPTELIISAVAITLVLGIIMLIYLNKKMK